jgi:cysteinyl-tRNA synthetase
LRVYNSLSRRKEVFPREIRDVKMFVCGPTVYDYAHLGHARTYIAFDIIARYLKFLGYSLRYLMNITDVADKIFDKARKVKRDPRDLTLEFEQAFKTDMEALGVDSIEAYERASDHIPQMIEQIKGMIEKKIAYETETGVYFEVGRFPKFGALSGLSHEELSLRRLELCSTKNNPEDFSLWRKQTSAPAWDSPWGPGRPGWHVEDTAISMQSFGETYEIHGGASELMFPHHEAEIAQAETLTGKTPFVKFWLHTGLLTVGGRKMSKSLGNVVLIRDALKDYTPQELRWYFASYHYREPVIMSKAILKKSRHEFHSFRNNIEALRRSNLASDSKTGRVDQLATNLEQNFRRSMDNDFYTPGALKSLSTYAVQLSKQAKGRKIDAHSRERAEALLRRLGAILGIEI